MTPSLLEIAALPFERSLYIWRLERLIDRYRRLSLLAIDPDHPRLLVETLLSHPGGLREVAGLTREDVAARAEMARVELENVRAAAPLPAPIQRIERTRMLAIADLEWIVTEIRFLRRFGLAAYGGRPDPLPGSPERVTDLVSIRRKDILQHALKVASLRHGVSELDTFLWPIREDGRNRATVGLVAEIREGCAKRVSVGKNTVAVFCDRGELLAIDDACPHRGGPLGKGKVENGAVVCPLHGWTFDLRTGALRTNASVRVRTHRVAVEGDTAYLETPALPVGSTGGHRDRS